MAARISPEAGPASSQCRRLKPRGVSVKASTQTRPRYGLSEGGLLAAVSPKQRGGEGSVWTLIYTLNVVLD